MTKHHYLTGALLLGAAALMPAHAYFLVRGTAAVRPPDKVPGEAAAQAGPTAPSSTSNVPSGYVLTADTTPLHLEQVGKPNHRVATLPAGESEGVPLSAGLKILLPKGWQAYVHDGVSRTQTVKWKNASNWIRALHQIAMQTGTAITVDWSRSSVYIDPMPTVSTVADCWKTGSGTGNPGHEIPCSDAPGGVSAAALNSTLARATEVFTLKVGTFINRDLIAWGNEAGWSVVWNVPQKWVVPHTTHLNGSFKQAISEVIRALASNGANIHVKFHTGNNVALIYGSGGNGDVDSGGNIDGGEGQ